jgi:hypothetical protein
VYVLGSTPIGVLQEEGVDMAKNGVVRARQAMGASLLAVLSVLPYAIIYAIDRGLGVPDAARSALWPTAVVPVLVAAVVAVPVLRARASHQAKRVL